MGVRHPSLLLMLESLWFFGGEESYLLLEGESRRRSRLRTWEDGRPMQLLFRPWRWFVYCGVLGGEQGEGDLEYASEVAVSLSR